MDVGGHVLPFRTRTDDRILRLMIRCTASRLREKNAKKKQLSITPLLQRCTRISSNLSKSPILSIRPHLDLVTPPITNSCCAPWCSGMASGRLRIFQVHQYAYEKPYERYQKHIIIADLPSFSSRCHPQLPLLLYPTTDIEQCE